MPSKPEWLPGIEGFDEDFGLRESLLTCSNLTFVRSGLSYYVWNQISSPVGGIMVIALVRHKVADFARWKQVFDGHFGTRHGAGELSCRMFHNHDNPTDLTLFFEWETLERARAFFSSEPLKNGMQQAGVVGMPEIIFLDEIRSLRRTAAD